MEVAENRAIGFNAFVNNATKAATEFTGAAEPSDIYVIGFYGEKDGALDQKVFNNEPGNYQYFWNVGKDYMFGAYADGKQGKVANATFDPAQSKLTFTNYTPSTKDLVAAISDKITEVQADQGKVNLTFKHMLAQVGFTFNTKVGEGYTLAISDIQIENAIKTATGTYTTSAISWTGGSATGEGEASYSYTDISDLANGTNTNTEFNLVIPQTLTSSNIKVTFTASISGVGIDDTKTKEIAVMLPTGTVNEWEAGYKYNYTTTINGENITDELKPIEFQVETIPVWDNGAGNNFITPEA